MGQKIIEKEAIIAEYLAGEFTYVNLRLKYGIDYRVIHLWETKCQGKSKVEQPTPIKGRRSTNFSNRSKGFEIELRKAQLHNKILNAMIDIAEVQLKINIRKKSCTKR